MICHLRGHSVEISLSALAIGDSVAKDAVEIFPYHHGSGPITQRLDRERYFPSLGMQNLPAVSVLHVI
jgi:hypothetical protein